MDFCQIVKNIQKEPHRNVQDWGILTVRDFLEIQKHVLSCDKCDDIVERVIEQAPPQIGFKTDKN